MILGMHMANELLTPSVAVAFIVLSGAVLAYASRATKRTFAPENVPLMGVMGAFVFAAQMINFPVLPGTSGHLGGGVLLAILLGPHAATLVMASILIVQCLIFQDGGVLALGTNIFNLGVIPCYLGYALFRVLAGDRPKAGRLYGAVFGATLIGMLLGAAMVPVQVSLSGVAAVPFGKFLLVMIGVHLVVALGEAVITFLVIGYLSVVRPASLGPVAERLQWARAGLSSKMVVASLLVVALLLGGAMSLYASEWPDALESIASVEEAGDTAVAQENSDSMIAAASAWQERTAPLPDYERTSFSGVLGAMVTLAIVWGIGQVLRRKSSPAAVTAAE